MNIIKTEGVVLKAIKYSESDLILTVFARSLGKISVLVKGAKKTRSKNLASSQIFSMSEFSLKQGISMYTVSHTDIIKNRFKLTESIETYAYSSFMAHLVERNTLEGNTNLRLFKVFNECLDLMEIKDNNKRYILIIFMLKFFDYTGYKPMVSHCVNCSSTDMNLAVFNPEQGGLLCSNCKVDFMGNIKIDPVSVKLIRYIYENEVETSVKANVSEILVNQLYFILLKYIQYHYDNISFKTLKVLKELS